MNPKLIEELKRRLEIRKKQLLGELELGYKLHRGHHIRDIFTVLAVLNDDPKAEQLLNNMPQPTKAKTVEAANECLKRLDEK